MEIFFYRFFHTLVTGNITFLVFSCSGGKQINTNQSDWVVVADRTQTENSEIITCNFSLLKDTVYFPLSELIEDLEIVLLDDADGALVDNSQPLISDNYILITNLSFKPLSYKLFDRSGKFITTIGRYGQGPNEYIATADCQLDEKNNRIFIMSYQHDRILTYDLSGNPLPSIPLYQIHHRGVFRVNMEDSAVICSPIPYNNKNPCLWVQDFEGNLIQYIPPGSVLGSGYNSPSVFRGGYVPHFNYYLNVSMPSRSDTLFRYDKKGNRLLPVFTVNYPVTIEVPEHHYMEFPRFFICLVAELVQYDAKSFEIENYKYYAINKKTLKGSFIKLYNDFLGNENMETDFFSFFDGYYAKGIEPEILREKLKEMLKNPDLDDRLKRKAEQIIPNLKDNGNIVVLFGKLKNMI